MSYRERNRAEDEGRNEGRYLYGHSWNNPYDTWREREKHDAWSFGFNRESERREEEAAAERAEQYRQEQQAAWQAEEEAHYLQQQQDHPPPEEGDEVKP